jgi:hypothetical protein
MFGPAISLFSSEFGKRTTHSGANPGYHPWATPEVEMKEV